MAKPVLYQFPVSSYCEKARWALDYKHVAFTTRNLLPLFHMPTVFRRTRQNKVPVLKLDSRYIADSAVIIQTLGERFPSAPSLFPQDDTEREEALAWAAFADREIGPHVRRTIYFHLLEHPGLVFNILTEGQNTVRRMAFRTSQPVVLRAMKEGMGITERGFDRSLERLNAALDRLDDRLKKDPYLVGDRFTVADLTVAALLSQLAQPPQAPFQFPADVPETLTSFLDEFSDRPTLSWVRRMYEDHRGR